MKKPIRNILILASIAAVAAIGLDAVLAVKPGMPAPRAGDPDPARPQPGDPEFHRTPLAPSFEERQAAYLQWLLPQVTPDDRGGVWMDIGKLEAGGQQINPAALQAALDFVNARQDPSDFTLNGLVRLYYLNADNGKLTNSQKTAIQAALLNFKYWLDEPNTSYVEMWTENHQILSASSEYLAGQRFPQEVFSNDGLTGEQKMEKARARMLRWMDWRARTGFAEWDSITYFPEDLAPLLNLVDFAQEPEIATRASMLVDLILFDTVVDSFYGQFGTSHGRVTPASIKSAAGDSMLTVQALAWGLGRFQSTSNMGAITLATTQRYQVPAVLQSIALDVPQVYTNFERDSIPLTAQAADQYGLSFDDMHDLPIWWGMGAFTSPQVINTTIGAADQWDLWHYPDFKALRDIAKILQKTHLLAPASALLNPDSNGVLMSEVNKVTYRTPDAMLSSAQDYRKGEKGYQQHIWQATLGPYAVVFVTNPDSLRADDKQRPSYWMSNGRLPRTGQYQNVLVALYDISRYPSAPAPLEARHYAFTHAYFPQWAFDEVREVPAEAGGGWIFGRKGQGYVALYSHLPYTWMDSGPDAGQEVVAVGRRNVWICQIGRAALDGSFEQFIQAVTAANLTIKGLKVQYDAPGVGQVGFDWNGPLTVKGEAVPLSGYPRWENPYTQVDFGALQVRITFEGHSLELDFEKGTRTIQ